MEQKGTRLTGIIRDKSVADRVIRALMHSGVPGDQIAVVVSGVNEITFGANEGGVKVVRYPEASETGAVAPTYRSGDASSLTDYGIPETDVRKWEDRLRNGDMIFSVACDSGKCNMARSIFMDAGAREIGTMGGQTAGATDQTMQPPEGSQTQPLGTTPIQPQANMGMPPQEGAQPQPTQMPPAQMQSKDTMAAAPSGDVTGHPLSPEEVLNRNPDMMGRMAGQQPVVTDRYYNAVDSAPDQVPHKPIEESNAAAPSMSQPGQQGGQMQAQNQGEDEEELFIFIVTEYEDDSSQA